MMMSYLTSVIIDTRTTLRSLSETLQTTDLPSSPLCLASPAPTRYTWLQQISTYIFPDILLRMRIPSIIIHHICMLENVLYVRECANICAAFAHALTIGSHCCYQK